MTSFHFVPQLTSRPLGAISLAMLVYTGAGEVGRHATQGLVDGFRSSGDLRSPLLLRGAQAVALLTLTLGLGSLADAGLGAARAVAFCFPAIVGALLVQPAKTDRYDVRLK